ncbi:uncharacterized protein LOC143266315, partial [Megachile rotundata]|uniref:uncharacterized protein LOC143266315 n=1 Tax=Megachile rotundata TaxID=143995 RepID=UPI003FD0A092
MAELVAKQERLQYSIDRALVNFKKIGKDNVTIATVKSRISTLKETWQQFQAGDLLLAEKVPADKRAALDYFRDQRFEATEEVYQTTLDFYENRLEELRASVSAASNAPAVPATSKSGHLPLAQLPAIQLPPFDGKLDEWRHHSLLHEETVFPRAAPANAPNTPNVSSLMAGGSEINTHLVSANAKVPSPVLLATAIVMVQVPSGRCLVTRALIDQGSEASFISEALAQALHAKRTRVSASISAVGGVHAGTARHATRIIVSPRVAPSPTITTTALVLNSLSTYCPKSTDFNRALAHLADLPWADSNPSSQVPVHLILGADVYSDIILEGVRKGGRGQPIAQRTIFGWIISGPSSAVSSFPRVSVHHSAVDESLSQTLQKFWEIEELPSKVIARSPEDERCEKFFQVTTSRTSTGQYIVRLPFRDENITQLGHSRQKALIMLNSLFRKFRSQNTLATEYKQFMQEYENLGHMRRVPRAIASKNLRVYIPHHPVIRDDSTTTKLRVVFNASSVTSSGLALNDLLLPGPKLQSDLPSVVNRWRQFRYVYTADIAKMYRQILVHQDDLDFQRILWTTSDPNQPYEYQLLTVTYGMNCAPYLALRVIQQLILDEGNAFPLAVPLLRDCTYVDDILFGENDVESLRRSREQLIGLLNRGHFSLRKWASNSAELLSNIDSSDHGLACSKELSPDDQVKILGVAWNPSRDSFHFRVSLARTAPTTKRSILSIIAKLYDPLGWVAPATISAKIFIQELWRLRVSWDETLPESSLRKWQNIYTHWRGLDGASIPRWTGLHPTSPVVELHGFADASTVAYAAVIYLKVVSSTGETTVSLLACKSKVAPLKPLTIPRLELSAAVLLARLFEFIRASICVPPVQCFCWTDSSVVLAWLNQHPSHWKTFVANRVTAIQSMVPNAEWRHVPSSDNPADCASRGLKGTELRKKTLWWQGPTWLREPESGWPSKVTPSDDSAASERRILTCHATAQTPTWDLAIRISSWTKLIRVTAYIRRFVNRCRSRSSLDVSPLKNSCALTAEECAAAKTFWLAQIQQEIFSKEIQALKNAKPLSRESRLLALTPFLDKDGLLRMGGRLQNTSLSVAAKHPIILGSHPLVE